MARPHPAASRPSSTSRGRGAGSVGAKAPGDPEHEDSRVVSISPNAARGVQAVATARSRYVLRLHGREIEVPSEGIIGRSRDAWLRLEDGLVSRRHARIRPTKDGLLVDDLGSRNGVRVNQRSIQGPTRVVHGDVLGVGLQSLEVVDRHVLRRPETLSTMPPPAPADHEVSEITETASLSRLSEREREVLDLIVRGHTQREIASKLFVSPKTVESHRSHLGDKLGCRTRAELISYAIAAGILRDK